MQAWTEPGPFECVGKHYRIRYVNPWPRPLQQPHPAIWIPGAGRWRRSSSSPSNRYAYMGIPYFHIDVFQRNFSMFRDACEAEGYTGRPAAGGLARADLRRRDRRAGAQEYEEHLWYFVKRLLPGITIQPPGYTSARSLAQHPEGGRARSCSTSRRGRRSSTGATRSSARPRPSPSSWSTASAGSAPATCSGCSSSAACPHDLTAKNMELFAEQVMPRLRAEFPEGAPVLPAVGEGGLMAAFAEEYVDTPDRQDPAVAAAAAGRRSCTCTRPAASTTHPALEELAESYEVIVPMFPGFGESEGIEQIDGMEDAVFHLLDVWEMLGLDAPADPRAVARRLDGARAGDPLPGAGRRSWCWSTRSGSTSTARRSSEMFGRTPGRARRDAVRRPDAPDRRRRCTDGRVRRRRRQGRRDPDRVGPADVEGDQRHGQARLGPVPAQPEAAGPAPPHHRADAGRRGRAGRARAAGLRGDVRGRDPGRPPRGDRGRRALAAVREARRPGGAGAGVPALGLPERPVGYSTSCPKILPGMAARPSLDVDRPNRAGANRTTRAHDEVDERGAPARRAPDALAPLRARRGDARPSRAQRLPASRRRPRRASGPSERAPARGSGRHSRARRRVAPSPPPPRRPTPRTCGS